MDICSKPSAPSGRPFRWIVRTAVAVCVFAASGAPAAADPITYQLVAVAGTGPLAGQTSSGTVTFDSSIIPPGGGRVVGAHLFTNVDFEWNGVAYTAANTQTSSLQFDAQGMLKEWAFGTACIAGGGGCVVRLFPPGFQDWQAANISATHHSNSFEYSRTDLSFGFGTATLSATPEPASLGLLLAGVAGFFGARRRRAH